MATEGMLVVCFGHVMAFWSALNDTTYALVWYDSKQHAMAHACGLLLHHVTRPSMGTFKKYLSKCMNKCPAFFEWAHGSWLMG